ncbi:MAG: undecaprenyl/decaprenyl-phosphate alpha-N-acetylglucosaminyl 1-phosphate transferase, partial [Acidimicrobiia bacterium]|nr:undecaprenyl/decaprenyl-phosphate alpha-N-acetylglucosaminyl 1-phosphate transferase [Acidimicrobiia bacterium]
MVYLIAGAISLIVSGLMIKIGPRLGWIDIPDGSALKAHARAAIPLGGVGVFLAVHTAMAVNASFDWGLFIASALVFVVGLVDDRFQLSPKVRVIFELAAALLLLGFADLPLEITNPIHVLVVVVLVVGAANAVNLFDGLDGLVGTAGAVAGVGLALLAAGRSIDGSFGWILASALVGFLVFNWHEARVFLGDNGAYSVGVFLVYGLLTVSPTATAADILVALAVLGVFGLDMVSTLLRRRLAGVPMFLGDRSHLY